MSIPLPQLISKKCWEIFLDQDERWEVMQVKLKERPHLLFSENDDDETKEKEEEFESNLLPPPPPVTDGCDISGWRRECVMEVSTDLQGVLNIGASSFYFRKESQWPLVKSVSKCWSQLLSKLSISPLHTPPTISCKEASEEIEWKKGCRATKFALRWERNNLPVIISDCADEWKAMPGGGGGGSCGWTFDDLLKRFGDICWRFSDDHGETMFLSTYSKYIKSIEGMTDDSPLAIYDAEFGNDDPTSVLLKEYSVPTCFSRDLFELADCETRPPYRWILIGPARSGTGLHIDPLWTNAWVTVLQGKKRWILFPKDTPAEKIGMQNPQIPSVIWFRDYYDKVTNSNWPSEWKPVEILQHVGETVFVPNGWPHLVLNLELTVAVTHNYASEFGPFLRMWDEVSAKEQEFAKLWSKGLQKYRPDLWKLVQDNCPKK